MTATACKHHICHPDGPCNCPLPADPPNRRLLSATDFLGVGLYALRHMLKKVPDDYWRVAPSHVTVVCGCRRGLRFTATGFLDCACGRTLVWTGRSLYALKDSNG